MIDDENEEVIDEVEQDTTQDAPEEVEEEVLPEEEEELVPELDEELAPEVEPGLSYNGQKIVGVVTDVEVEGSLYKSFSVESGETFKITEAEYIESVI